MDAGKQTVKLIYNPSAGATRRKKFELDDVMRELLLWKLEPDLCILGEGCDLAAELEEARLRGISVFVACGGDGTVSAVANLLAGTGAALAVLPGGTQNNTAKSLGVPLTLPEAVATACRGRTIDVDLGFVSCGGAHTHFMEIVSIGLVSALNDDGDCIQHGDLTGLGGFLSTLVTCPPSEIRLTLDRRKTVKDTGHIALATNMPFAGFHYQFGSVKCFRDGLLNVLFFPGLSKPELLKHLAGGIFPGREEDDRIQHYMVRELDVETDPPMPVAADGRCIGCGSAHIELRPAALKLIAGSE